MTRKTSKDFTDRVDRYSFFIKLAILARSLWAKACAHDGMPIDSKFVVFSQDNPYSGPAGRAATQCARARKAARS